VSAVPAGNTRAALHSREEAMQLGGTTQKRRCRFVAAFAMPEHPRGCGGLLQGSGYFTATYLPEIAAQEGKAARWHRIHAACTHMTGMAPGLVGAMHAGNHCPTGDADVDLPVGRGNPPPRRQGASRPQAQQLGPLARQMRCRRAKADHHGPGCVVGWACWAHGAGWSHEECIESLMRKSGYRGPIAPQVHLGVVLRFLHHNDASTTLL